ncbi:MAG: YaiI/YqxD family protein [Hyphomicrobiales bacterium]|nr:YaiI/YqxD family protein [Hyphomicrobiales bacterium]
MTTPARFAIFVDADACPVKDEIYRVAERRGARVFVVSNSFMQAPRAPFVERVIVAAGPDVADDWIAERAGAEAVVVTADLPLADRCVKKGACVLSPKGQEWSAANIGSALATRNLMTDLRSAGAVTSGPPPFSPRDRSAFLQALDLALVRMARRRPKT